VAFWTFVVAQSGDGAFVGPITVSVIVTLLSLPASVLGNEAALRFGRHRAITAVMVASAAVALAIGLNVGSSPLLLLALVLVYGSAIPADSGALTSGTTASATPALSRGDSGIAFDGGIRPFGARRLGRRCSARRGGRAGAAGGMVRLVRTARGRSSSRSHRVAMVTARTRDCIIAT